MFILKDIYIYEKNENIENLFGMAEYKEETKDEAGEVIETINYKFNLETGEYEKASE